MVKDIASAQATNRQYGKRSFGLQTGDDEFKA
jgi:hypothetical protein